LSPEPIQRRAFDAQWLMDVYPPRWHHRNKQAVFDMSCPPGSRHAGEIDYTRWGATPLPEQVDAAAALELLIDRPGFYDYVPAVEGAVEWHVNFADPNLFTAYGSALFAQDEMQVTEHPALGALREALVAAGLPVRTVEAGDPTPVLVRGVERRCTIATKPDADAGRPFGLYGNEFSRADADVVRQATGKIDPPTTTNLIAIAAPLPSSGRYTAEQIEYALVTATTAFRAAVSESGGARPVVVHSGFWGCGAFGGNRALMTTLQVLAVELACMNRIVLHTGDPSGAAPVEGSRQVLAELGEDGPTSVTELIDHLFASGFLWGESDGN
jgi:Poly (ADP-ribose) glycohydrolase (PARG), Macro domain fold